MKKTLAFIMCFTLLMSLYVTTSALDCPLKSNATAKVAFVIDVAEDGANISNDSNIGSNTTLMDTSLKTSTAADGSLSISLQIKDDILKITGTPSAKSSNRQALYFSGLCTNTKYSVVNMEYVDSTSTGMFFSDYCTTTKATSVLKLYLKDETSPTKDYIFIECFDYLYPAFNTMIDKVPTNTVMGAWVAREFKPIDCSSSSYTPYLQTNTQQREYTVTFKEFECPQIHTITLASTANYGNIPVGSHEHFTYTLKIIGKTMSCKDNPSLNSNTESFLHVKSAALTQTTVPNTAFIDTTIDGDVQIISAPTSLSASLAIGIGPLSLSLSSPLSVDDPSHVDLNAQYTIYCNDGSRDEYARTVVAAMDNNYVLSQIGHKFSVEGTIGDFGNVKKSAATHRAKWDITIINAADTSPNATTDDVLAHGIAVAIQ